MCPKSQCCLPAPILLSCLKLSWLAFPFSRLSFSVRMSVEVEHKQIFHFMPLKLTLSYIKEYNVDLKVFGASPQNECWIFNSILQQLKSRNFFFSLLFSTPWQPGLQLGQFDGLWHLPGAPVTLVSVVDLDSGQPSVSVRWLSYGFILL